MLRQRAKDNVAFLRVALASALHSERCRGRQRADLNQLTVSAVIPRDAELGKPPKSRRLHIGFGILFREDCQLATVFVCERLIRANVSHAQRPSGLVAMYLQVAQQHPSYYATRDHRLAESDFVSHQDSILLCVVETLHHRVDRCSLKVSQLCQRRGNQFLYAAHRRSFARGAKWRHKSEKACGTTTFSLSNRLTSWPTRPR